MSDDTTLEVKGLDKLLKALKSKPPKARIGILGDAARSGDKGVTNAQIGAAHEFGTTHLPVRSFLRVPLTDHLNKQIESSGALDKEALAQVMESGSVVSWMRKIMIIAEGIVADAFDSGGFGKWQPSNMAKKKVQQTLVETQQLRNSITSEVKE
jgi:phage gpG-like protein